MAYPLQAQFPQALHHDLTWRQHHIELPIESRCILCRRASSERAEAMSDHVLQIGMIKRHDRHIELTLDPQRGPRNLVRVAHLDHIRLQAP